MDDSIEDVIGKYVTLANVGDLMWLGECPFCGWMRLMVLGRTQSFYCEHCRVVGNAEEFEKKYKEMVSSNKIVR